MKKIILGAVGSTGDILPIVALGIELRKKGHEITFCGSPNGRKFVEKHQFPFHPVGLDVEKMMDDSVRYMFTNPLRAPGEMINFMRKNVDAQFKELTPLVKGADFLVGSSVLSAGISIAQYYGIPYTHVLHTPQAFESQYHVPPTFPFQNMPSWANLLVWKINGVFANHMLKNIINTNRAKFGLPPFPDIWKTLAGDRIIIPCNEILGPIPPDVKQNYYQTEYWHYIEEAELDPAILNFINSGKTPVYLGFGSMGDPMPEKTNKIIDEILRSSGLRFIISKGWADIGSSINSPDVMTIDYAPHLKLFPLMAAIIHHGGAGTTHTAARSGVPQIIIPHLMDQFYWANRISKLNLGLTLNRLTLTASKLLNTINKVISEPSFKQNAYELSRKTPTDGLNKAVDLIENWLK